MKRVRKTTRFVAVLLCLSMLVLNSPLLSVASEAGAVSDGLCVHHPEHTPECGYQIAVQGEGCTHTHDESCGYVEEVKELACSHVHDETCGYAEEKVLACPHEHDETCGYVADVPEVLCDHGCSDTDGDGMIDHVDGCAYQPAQSGTPCTHEHDDSCYTVAQTASSCTHEHSDSCYKTVQESSPCAHEHSESCEYTETTITTPCGYAVNGCPYCVSQWQWDDVYDVIEQKDNKWIMAVPAVSEEHPLTAQVLKDTLLPKSVSAVAADGKTMTVALDWELTNLGDQPITGGEYTVKAKLEEPYALTETAAVPELVLMLGSGENLVDPLADIAPEQNFIVVSKTITGLTEEQMTALQGNLVITVSGNDQTYTLKYGENGGSIQFRDNGAGVWSWRINGATGGNYNVTESGCDPEDLGLPEGTTWNPNGTGRVSIENADIGLVVSKEETCSHKDWPLYEGCFFAGTLTSKGVVVITTRAPSASQRAAIEAAFSNLPGPWRRECYYFSLNSLNIDAGNTDPDYNIPITVNDAGGKEITTLTYYPNQTYDGEGTPGQVVFKATNVWQHVAKVTYDTSAIQLADIRITNAYHQPVVLDGSTNLKISKTLTGRDWRDADEFSFTITAEDNAPLPAPTTVTVYGDPDETTQTVSFGDITYTEPGTYVYSIREKSTTIPGVSSDTSLYKVTVTVTEGENGVLQTAVTYKKSDQEYSDQEYSYNETDGMAFVNKYSLTEDVERLRGHKHLSGKTLENGDFEFYIEKVTVSDDVGSTEYGTFEAATQANVPLPSLVTGFGEEFALANGGTVDEPSEIFFGALTFRQEHVGKTYVYTIKEVIPDPVLKGYTYDEEPKTVTYTVTSSEEDVEAVIEPDPAAPTEDDHGYFTFENEYEPLPVTWSPVFYKTLTGRDMDTGETFSFTLTANSQNPLGATLPQTTTIQVGGLLDSVQSQPLTFDLISFDAPGSYQFYIKETGWNGADLPENPIGMTFDTSTISVTCKVEDVDGRLTVKDVTYEAGRSVFQNHYDEYPVTITKKVAGNFGDRDKEFQFSVTADTAMKLGSGVTGVTLSHDGKTATFALKHDGSVTLMLPKGAQITNIQEIGDTEGYTVAITEGGVESSFPLTVTQSHNITVTNTKNVTPDTGISLDSLPYVLILVLAAAGVFLLLHKRRRDA